MNRILDRSRLGRLVPHLTTTRGSNLLGAHNSALQVTSGPLRVPAAPELRRYKYLLLLCTEAVVYGFQIAKTYIIVRSIGLKAQGSKDFRDQAVDRANLWLPGGPAR